MNRLLTNDGKVINKVIGMIETKTATPLFDNHQLNEVATAMIQTYYEKAHEIIERDGMLD